MGDQLWLMVIKWLMMVEGRFIDGLRMVKLGLFDGW